MVVSFVIPIKKHLVKFLRPRSFEKRLYIGLHIIPYIFFQFNGYKINSKFDKNAENIRSFYIESKLFRVYRPGENMPDYLQKYDTLKYTFLKFNFPVQKNKQQYNNHYSIDREIRYLNYGLEYLFWEAAKDEILKFKKLTLKQGIDKFYYEYRLTNKDYSKKSFIVMLYRKSKGI